MIPLANHKLFIAIAAFPAPRKIPLIKNNNTIDKQLAIIILVKFFPYSAACSDDPIQINKSFANINPKILNRIVMIIDNKIACEALSEAFSGFFSPILRAIMAVAAILIPIEIE